ncbi:MAG: hypothetical protein ABJF23_02175 [Bryobacteraceae bacterium]
MSLQIQKKTFAPIEIPNGGKTRDIAVLYTTAGLTEAALEHAKELSRGMNLHVLLVHAQIVPYALPLDEPQVTLQALKDELQKIAGAFSLEIEGTIVLARDMQSALASALKPDTVIVLASHKRLWRTKEESLRNECVKAGHEVVLCYVS